MSFAVPVTLVNGRERRDPRLRHGWSPAAMVLIRCRRTGFFISPVADNLTTALVMCAVRSGRHGGTALRRAVLHQHRGRRQCGRRVQSVRRHHDADGLAEGAGRFPSSSRCSCRRWSIRDAGGADAPAVPEAHRPRAAGGHDEDRRTADHRPVRRHDRHRGCVHTLPAPPPALGMMTGLGDLMLYGLPPAAARPPQDRRRYTVRIVSNEWPASNGTRCCSSTA